MQINLFDLVGKVALPRVDLGKMAQDEAHRRIAEAFGEKLEELRPTVAHKLSIDNKLRGKPHREYVRTALYWFWERTVKSSHVADVIRKSQTEGVCALVLPHLRPETSNEEIARRVARAIVEVTL